MSTLKMALQKRDQDADTHIACMIVSIHVFFTERSVLVTVVFIDREGKTFEVKAWSPRKAYYVYFNFKEGQHVLLRCVPEFLEQVNSKYSGADYEITRRSWMLEPSKNTFRPKSYFKVHYDIAAFHESSKPVKSIVGMFVQMGNGPLKFNSEGRVVARGHYCKFKDAKNRTFQALLWESANRKFRFSLKDCATTELVLIPFAREQEQRYRSSRMYTITTLYPPIVNSHCINVSRWTELTQNYRTHSSEPYNPYS